MKREIINTEDGSSTLYVPELDEHYHSIYGAITESMHIFINYGFNCIDSQDISIFEVGFGTGLNSFLTFREAKKQKKKVIYDSVELYPLTENEYLRLNYVSKHENDFLFFIKMHSSDWDIEQKINDNFLLKKITGSIETINIEKEKYDLIYFDAFAPEVQPELWKKEIFQSLYNSLKPNGILTTYCSKGVVRRTLKEVGFKIEKLPGPPPKREIVRAIK